ncbi:D-Ala-D-Ala carboxypeptidase family metallohydrolase [Prevotella melaninogenica]|uniref:D-Ala-D-Ala carboxypeptidase family metallohydrolase n=1 Tax=Prevotella melaninogenica TaxID=28132 RepID=UPI001BA66EF8|nr:D-Ala-D-Ala carboxypeptidase family metallohydrolase [Prevotella melaninogenica]QUB64899.1 peptidase M15A [Prevotella melaninogenica]
MANFTIAEMVQSNTADRLKISNNPPASVRVHLTETITLLESIRAEWAKYCAKHSLENPAICISSGYRSPELNKAIGGAKTSAHQFGYAADIQPVNGKQDEFERFFASEFSKMGYAFDQIIIEKSKTSRWVHVGYKRADGKQRRQCFTLNV